MRILNIAYSDRIGGSSKTTYRLHRALRDSGLDSLLLVRMKGTDDPSVIQINSILPALHNRVRSKIDYEICRLGTLNLSAPYVQRSCNLVPSMISGQINRLEPDVVIAHWVGASTISLRDVSNVRAPILWRLADEWVYSGTTHFSTEAESSAKCAQWNCTGGGEPAHLTWLDKVVIAQKIRRRAIFRHVVAPSTWLAERAAVSPVLSQSDLSVIPNPTDIRLFYPRATTQRHESDLYDRVSDFGFQGDDRGQRHRDRLNLVFLSASNVLDPRKGFSEVVEAVERYTKTGLGVTVNVVGSDAVGSVPDHLRTYFQYLGELPPTQVADYLRNANGLIAPSKQEGLPQVGLEALASGVPVVAYRGTAFEDVVDHRVTGYLAKLGNISGLVDGLHWLTAQNSDSLARTCRATAVLNYAPSVVVDQYVGRLQSMTS